MDILFSILLLPLVIIIIAICGILIKLEDHGTVLYINHRLGINGKKFKMLKLRTMKEKSADIRNKDGSTFNSIDDPRLTRVGKILRKTSLDELPQIINVLIGDMSFIGPRPDLPEQLERYSEVERNKLFVRPGITGYSQAYFRNSISASEKFKNDVKYVENISFIMDFKILYTTFMILIKRSNVFNESDKTIYNQPTKNSDNGF